MTGDTSKWHFEHRHPVQMQIRSNHNIREIYKSTRNIDIQYDKLNSTREVLKHIRSSDVSCKM